MFQGHQDLCGGESTLRATGDCVPPSAVLPLVVQPSAILKDRIASDPNPGLIIANYRLPNWSQD